MRGVSRPSDRRQLAAEAEQEFAAFVTRDKPPLLRFAYLLTGDRQDAEDLVQSALLRCATRWAAARLQPEGYARTVLVNLARDRWRRLRRPRHAALDGRDECQVELRHQRQVELPDLPERPGRSENVVDRHVLVEACCLLPMRQRAVLVLRFWEDRSVEDTAALLGCSAGTVKTHTHRALDRLRQLLADCPDNDAWADNPTTRTETATHWEPQEASC